MIPSNLIISKNLFLSCSSYYYIRTLECQFDVSLMGFCNLSPQLRDNEQLSRLCAEQETRLGDLERRVENQVQEEEDRRRMLEDVQSDKATISRALTQNRTLKDQLAELQNGFVKVVRQSLLWMIIFCLSGCCTRYFIKLEIRLVKVNLF